MATDLSLEFGYSFSNDDDDDYYYYYYYDDDSGVETRRDRVPWKPLSRAHQTAKAKLPDKRYRNFQFKDWMARR